MFTPGFASEDPPVSNALIESFTVHARALIDFLYRKEKARLLDVIADDFFADPEKWAAIKPALSEPLDRARGRVNKEIAHLTYDRQLVDPELKGWDYRALSEAIMSAFGVFRARVSPELLGTRWSS